MTLLILTQNSLVDQSIKRDEVSEKERERERDDVRLNFTPGDLSILIESDNNKKREDG